jgi:hypothetical protein
VRDFDLAELGQIPDPLAGEVQPVAQAPTMPKEVSATRATVRRRRLLAMAFSVVWMGGLLATMGVASENLTVWGRLLACLLPAALGVWALGLALSPGKSGLGPSVKRAVVTLLAVPALFVGVSLLSGVTGALGKDSFICGELILVLGVVPLLALGLALRHSSPSRSLVRSALLGSAVGLLAATVQAVHCPKTEILHSLMGHGVPVIVLGALGATVVHKLTSV